jgi:HlyD family secretion protein
VKRMLQRDQDGHVLSSLVEPERDSEATPPDFSIPADFALRGRQKVVKGPAVFAALVLAGGIGAFSFYRASSESRSKFERLERVAVRRGDLVITLTAPGWIDCTEKTAVVCQLENVSGAGGSGGRGGGGGGGGAGAGSATILTLTPEGSYVHKDEVLCELDSSGFTESLRQQQIELDSARAALTKAELDVAAAEIGVKQYIEGTRSQTVQNFQGQVALSESDFRRQSDRMVWAVKMKKLGFVSTSDYTGEIISLMRAEQSLSKTKRTYSIFENFSDVISRRNLESRLEGLRAMLDYSRIRFQKSSERLAKLKQQVANCTIRAPHDGFLIYGNPRRGRSGGTIVELGAQVRFRQDLFYLPNLTKLEVQALLHESILARVRSKMAVRLRIEVFPDEPMKGSIGSIAVLPIPVDQNSERSTDTRNFLAKIPLDSAPKGAKPGMSVEVEILSSLRDNALLAPIKSVKYRDGHPYCYIKRVDHVEERAIEVGQMNRQFFEITRGLSEGEYIVMDPTQIDASMVVTPEHGAKPSISPQIASVRP